MAFQSTLPAWGATRRREILLFPFGISIHAPRVGSDKARPASLHIFMRFQSTLPAWGATLFRPPVIVRRLISIHAPRVGSDFGVGDDAQAVRISIHAPRVGSDCGRHGPFVPQTIFQSTLPAWGATPVATVHDGLISIHAPRVGSDFAGEAKPRAYRHFNPRSPRGERPGYASPMSYSRHFNPRSPRGERPPRRWECPCRYCYFNPRSPRGERPVLRAAHAEMAISIHAPRVGSDFEP